MGLIYVFEINNPKYIFLHKQEDTIVTNEKFNKYWKTNTIKLDPNLQNFRLDKNNTNEILFNYYPVNSKNIDLVIYSLNNTPNKLKSTTVDQFPSLIRKASHKFPVFARIDGKGNSGFYDFQEDRYLLEDLEFADIGNVSLDNSGGLKRLTAMCEKFNEKSQKVLTLGGDHATTFYNLRAINKASNKKPILIQLDAHQDIGKHELNNNNIHQGNFISHLLDNEFVEHVIQIGIRGIRSRNQVVSSEKITVINSSDWDKFNYNFLNNILHLYNNYDIYLSIDIDVLDPSEFSFVDFPVKWGLTTKQLISTIKEIFKSEGNIIGADIVEVNGEGNIDNNDYDLIIYILIHLMEEFANNQRSD